LPTLDDPDDKYAMIDAALSGRQAAVQGLQGAE
jgi:hypothetical protein